MASAYLSSTGVAVLNHLWQSTLFAVAIGLLTLLLRRNPARVRYSLWLAASLKFLLPFSLLVGVGNYFARPHPAASVQPRLSVIADEVAAPLAAFAAPVKTSPVRTARHKEKELAPGMQIQATETVAAGTVTVPLAALEGAVSVSLRERVQAWLPEVVAGLWFCGVMTVLALWVVRWRRVWLAARAAVVLDAGREVSAMQRMERVAGGRRIPLLQSRVTMEPGIFGVFRPVLLWPEGLSERLEDEHIDAIVAHEWTHARRRDNLTVTLHMAVEALFWFHPLVWWMERRLVEERERACDEAVVEHGGRAEAYAESLLRACRFCVESPLACVAGITGADLSRRIRSIMTPRLQRLSVARKVVLAVLAVVVIGTPVLLGQLHASLRMRQELSPSQPIRQAVVLAVTKAMSFAAPMKQPPAGPPQKKQADGSAVSSFVRNASVQAGVPPERLQAGPVILSGTGNGRASQASLEEELTGEYKKWVDEEVRWIITDQELVAFKQLKTDQERDAFLEAFWQRRGAGAQDEYYRRIAYANDRFGTVRQPGWKSDRGMIYIKYGKPDDIESHSEGGEVIAPGGRQTVTYPFEVWRYRSIPGLGDKVDIEFVDSCRCGRYDSAFESSKSKDFRAENMGQLEQFTKTLALHAPTAADGDRMEQLYRAGVISRQTYEQAALAPMQSSRTSPAQQNQRGVAYDLIAKGDPRYPQAALNARIEGQVDLRGSLTQEGKFTNLQVVSGPAELRRAALDAMQAWQGKPTGPQGMPWTLPFLSWPLNLDIIVEFELNSSIKTQGGEPVVSLGSPANNGQLASIEQMRQFYVATQGQMKANLQTGMLHLDSSVLAQMKTGGSEPVYPQAARADHVQGDVTMHVVLSPEGKVSSAQPLNGPEALRQAAVDAVKTWTYRPYLLIGRPVAVDATVVVHF